MAESYDDYAKQIVAIYFTWLKMSQLGCLWWVVCLYSTGTEKKDGRAALLTILPSASHSSPCLVWFAWWAFGTVAIGPLHNLQFIVWDRENFFWLSYNYRNKHRAGTRLSNTTCGWLRGGWRGSSLPPFLSWSPSGDNFLPRGFNSDEVLMQHMAAIFRRHSKSCRR